MGDQKVRCPARRWQEAQQSREGWSERSHADRNFPSQALADGRFDQASSVLASSQSGPLRNAASARVIKPSSPLYFRPETTLVAPLPNSSRFMQCHISFPAGSFPLTAFSMFCGGSIRRREPRIDSLFTGQTGQGNPAKMTSLPLFRFFIARPMDPRRGSTCTRAIWFLQSSLGSQLCQGHCNASNSSSHPLSIQC